MESSQERVCELLYTTWYSYAKKLFNKVIEITELEQERANALEKVMLRPNDFVIKIAE